MQQAEPTSALNVSERDFEIYLPCPGGSVVSVSDS